MEKIRQTAKRLFTKLQEAEKRHQLEKKAFEVTVLRNSLLGKCDFYFILVFFVFWKSEELHGHVSLGCWRCLTSPCRAAGSARTVKMHWGGQTWPNPGKLPPSLVAPMSLTM